MISFNIDNELHEIFRALDLSYENFDFSYYISDNTLYSTLKYDNIYNYSYELLLNSDDIRVIRDVKTKIKADLYRLLSQIHAIELPYGSLTGVRPTKLFYDNLAKGNNPKEILLNKYNVSARKVELISRVVKNQRGIYNNNHMQVDLYVHIPFCPSKCSYCSFLSIVPTLKSNIVDIYMEKLYNDIEIALELIDSKSYYIRSIYVGGGTPSSLPLKHFSKLLSLIKGLAKEITVECGRPDTIDLQRLDVLNEQGITRISINPQTFNSKTLETIGRNHTITDIYNAFELCNGRNLDINLDLIAMLPNENMQDIANSVENAIRLNPENITVHTLALKRGARLKQEEYVTGNTDLAAEMVEYANLTLENANYLPYYLYRQKYISGNNENVGYAKPSKQCIYNIDIMEETNSIIACGAGAISKKVDNKGISRVGFAKDIGIYLEKFDFEMSDRNKLFN